MVRRRGWVVGIVLLICAVGACSSNKSSPVASSTTTTTTTTIPTTTSSAPVARNEAFCDAVKEGFRAENAVDLEHGSPESLRKSSAVAIAKVKAAQEHVPEAYKVVWAHLLEGLQKFEQVLADNNYGITAFKSSPAGKQLLNDPTLGQTFQRLENYLENTCGGTVR